MPCLCPLFFRPPPIKGDQLWKLTSQHLLDLSHTHAHIHNPQNMDDYLQTVENADGIIHLRSCLLSIPILTDMKKRIDKRASAFMTRTNPIYFNIGSLRKNTDPICSRTIRIARRPFITAYSRGYRSPYSSLIYSRPDKVCLQSPTGGADFAQTALYHQ